MIVIVLWTQILERFDSTSINLQRINIDLSCVVKLYKPLEICIRDINSRFDNILAEEKQMSGHETFTYEGKRKNKNV